MLPQGLDNQLLLNYYIAIASFTILYYDWFLTAIDEINYIWPPKNRLTFGSTLYFLNRYLALLSHVLVVYEALASHLDDHLFARLICLLRVSALYGNSRVVICMLSLIIIACFGVVLWSTLLWYPSKSTGSKVSTFLHRDFIRGCNPLYPQVQALRIAMTWASVLIFDVVIFILTLYKALRVGWAQPGTLFHILLRDGAIYFIILFFANLANILTFFFAPPLLKGLGGLVTNILYATLVSRLMLNLRVESSQQNEERARAQDVDVA
ncbi:hypothetical protein FA95DRAFT_1609930 [Auriscalpium vulgare]|uniref:Uncharacterized protein n=1 Tax=Auriscalpium vulgare TaxID=40419 RepID=A0ACB8RFS7_9AGAM|nr:hypothetical protein FA95DRAFT_1609930 [Auriscalpium vulgare]